jgi:prepilin-type N-terminal cleavage/methylation domain-containing protein
MFRRSGFTLIELLIVVTILAVLSGAAIPYVQDYVEDARISKAKTDTDELKNALALFETKRGETYSKNDGSDLVNKGFLTKLPIDPWGAPYIVASGSILSLGPDGLVNTADDVKTEYQPPLSVTSAQWWDADGTSTVTGNAGGTADRLLLRFTRPLKTPQTLLNATIAGLSFTPAGPTLNAGNIVCTDATGRVGYFTLNVVTNFVPGKTTLTIGGATTLVDQTNYPVATGKQCNLDTIKIGAR